jgi:hypothetical protein
MKFKVGDRVRVVKIDSGNHQECMGKVFTIKSVDVHHYYHYIFEEYSACSWRDEELELVSFAKFTKSDLKDGMVVEYRDGSRRMVMGDMLISHSSHNELYHYNDTLENVVSFCSIDKVYKSKSINLNEYFKDRYLTLIWERPKEELVKEMTVAEIEKELGYKVKIKLEN